MEAKLIKVLEHYHLYAGDKAIATTIVGNPMLLPNLSLKNCQEIELDYDLDELANELLYSKYPFHPSNDSGYWLDMYKEGFKKALEILGDKKFSEKDLRTAYGVGYLMKINPSDEYHETLNGLVQLLQQTEWDVEVVTHAKENGSYTKEDGFEQEPKLDEDGCLILKRK